MKYKLVGFLAAIALLAGCSSEENEPKKQKEEPVVEEKVAEKKETENKIKKEVKAEKTLNLNERINELNTFYNTLHRIESENYDTKLKTIMVYSGKDAPSEAQIVSEMFDDGKYVDQLHLVIEGDTYEFENSDKEKIGNDGLYKNIVGNYVWSQDVYSYNLSISNEKNENEILQSFNNKIKANGEMIVVSERFKNITTPSYIPEGFERNYVEIRRDFEESVFVNGPESILYGLQNDKYDAISVPVSSGYTSEIPDVERIIGVTSTKEISGVVVAYKETLYNK